MSLLQNSNAISSGSYDVNNSLRIRSSATANLTRTPSSTTNRRTYTWSGWVKRGALPASRMILFVGDDGTVYTYIGFNSSYQLEFYHVPNTSGTEYKYVTSAVFRDPSAWYHIVLAVDTTQATAGNRVKIYVNGVQQTISVTTGYGDIPQNTDTFINTNNGHTSYGWNRGSSPFDGYGAETHFIDGSAKTPSDFGETDAVTGSWVAKKYTGTYGTNGFYLPFTLNSTSTYAGTFNGSNQYLSAPDNTAFSWGTGSFTVEGWIKTSTKTNYTCIVGKSNPAATDSWYIETDSGGYIHYGGNGGISVQGTKDVCDGNWHHFAIVRNGSTNVTLYIDGVSNATGSDTNAYAATGYPLTIGYLSSTYPRYFNGQISNLRIVKGSAVYTSNFVPSSTALTAITNTSILTLQNSTIIDNSTNAFTITNNNTVTSSSATPFVANITSDRSGNANNWATNNINYSTSGTTYDAMTDVPTNTSATVGNYCTLNPLESFTNPVPQQANLYFNGADYSQIKGTFWVSTGKWYFEWVSVSGSLPAYVGVSNVSITSNTNVTTSGISWYGHSNSYYKNFTGTSLVSASAISIGDIIGVAFDCDAGTVAYYKNNTLVHTDTTLTPNQLVAPTLIATFSGGGWSPAAFNFGQRPFSYTPPSGYKALNTYNLPDSTIKKGNSVMDATTYTGNGSSRSITNAASFKPDLVWIKSRSNAYANRLADSVRGAGKEIFSNETTAETTNDSGGYVSAFNSNGFSFPGGGVGVNGNALTYVAWQWQAGQGSTSSNTQGSITSTVSVNTTAGFSVITWSGNSTSGATIGHGLGVAPKMFIVKVRNRDEGWVVGHTSIGWSNFLQLNNTNASASSAFPFNNTAPSSTLITLGSGSGTNGSTYNYVGYAWAEIPGFSKIGAYTGNGSTDGPFVYTGFRPKFIMIKRTDTTSDWHTHDAARNTYNVTNNTLYPSGSYAEDVNHTAVMFDFTANGFKVRASHPTSNNNGSSHVYIAFAESPFKNSLAR